MKPRKSNGPQRAGDLEAALTAEREALQRLFDLPAAVTPKEAAAPLASGADAPGADRRH